MSTRLRDLVNCLLALLLAATFARAQDPVPPPPPLPETSRPDVAPKPWLDADGRPIEPGVLPASTSPEARALFEKLAAASLGAGGERKPIESFDLALDIRQRQSGQTNDVQARYRYRAPGWVRTTIEESGREHVRGPQGDFLIDPKRKEITRLDAGRENAEDRREIEDTLRTARNFLALTDPRSLRLVSLERSDPPPVALPKGVRGADLDWLELRTPDFQAAGGAPDAARAAEAAAGAPPAATAPIARVRLGLDRATGLAATALIDQNEARAGLRDSTLLLALDKYKPLDGFQVPTAILLFGIEEGSRPPAFTASPTSDIVVIAGRSKLRASLGPDDFVPYGVR